MPDLSREIRDKRIAVAKDVIARLDADKLCVATAVYMGPRSATGEEREDCEETAYDRLLHREQTTPLQPIIDDLEASCKVCALGAVFMSAVRLFNDADMGCVQGCRRQYKWHAKLAGIFDQTTLIAIEAMFECTAGIDAISWYLPGCGGRYVRRITRLAAQRGQVYRHDGYDRRCREAMQVLIDNDGEFIIDGVVAGSPEGDEKVPQQD